MISGLMDYLHKRTRSITEAKHFNAITGSLFMINPVVLSLQLYQVIIVENVEAVSVPLWVSFIVIQVATAFVGIKAKNFGLLLSMILSIIISLAIIVLTYVKLA